MKCSTIIIYVKFVGIINNYIAFFLKLRKKRAIESIQIVNLKYVLYIIEILNTQLTLTPVFNYTISFRLISAHINSNGCNEKQF